MKKRKKNERLSLVEKVEEEKSFSSTFPRGGGEWSRFWSKAIWSNWLELEMPPLRHKTCARARNRADWPKRGFKYLAIFAIFGRGRGIFANIEYWPLLNAADELALPILNIGCILKGGHYSSTFNKSIWKDKKL